MSEERIRYPHGLTREQVLELYHYMRLTRTLEERLAALYRQSKIIGGLFRSLGQEAMDVYRKNTEPVVEFYRGRDKLKTVDAEGSIDDIYQRLLSTLLQ